MHAMLWDNRVALLTSDQCRWRCALTGWTCAHMFDCTFDTCVVYDCCSYLGGPNIPLSSQRISCIWHKCRLFLYHALRPYGFSVFFSLLSASPHISRMCLCVTGATVGTNTACGLLQIKLKLFYEKMSIFGNIHIAEAKQFMMTVYLK